MITTTQTELLPIRRDGQTSIFSVNITSAGGSSGSGSGTSGSGTTYSAGNGICISGTTISVCFGSTSTTVACGSHLHTGIYLPINGCACDSARLNNQLPSYYATSANPVFTGTLKAPVISGGTCITAPIICASSCVNTYDLLVGNDASSAAYASGYAGCGWKIDKNGSTYDLEIDNLKVRNNLSAYQMEINEVNAVNGGLIISSANGVAYCVNGTNIYFDTDNNCNPIQFATNDYVKAQVYTGAGTCSYLGRVTGVYQCATLGCAYVSTATISGTPWSGMKLVQVGNCTTAARQNLIYLTASDTNNPFIDGLAGVTDGTFSGKQVFRLGNLAGITDACFGGALSGYGLYANNIYLRGIIQIASGSGYSNLTDKPTSLANINASEGGKLTSVACNANYTTNTNQLTDGANLGGTAVWTCVSSRPTCLASINASEGGKLTSVACGATVGATWGTNLYNVPTRLADTPSGAGLYISSQYLGYYNGGSWQSYIDCTGAARFVGVTEFGTCACTYGDGKTAAIALKNADIYETAYNGSESVLWINRIGYQGGTTQYRNTAIGDGKGNSIAIFNAGQNNFWSCTRLNCGLLVGCGSQLYGCTYVACGDFTAYCNSTTCGTSTLHGATTICGAASIKGTSTFCSTVDMANSSCICASGRHCIVVGTTDICAPASASDMTSLSASFTPKGNKILVMFSAPIAVISSGWNTGTFYINVGGSDVRTHKVQYYDGVNSVSFQHIASVTPNSAVCVKMRWSGTNTNMRQRGSTDSERIMSIVDLL